MQSFSLVEMWHTMGFLAKLVVIVLGVMSMFSLGVIAERFYTFLRAQRQSVSYVVGLRGFIQARRLREAVGTAAGHKHSPIAKVIGAGLTEYVSGLEALTSKGPEDVGDFDLVLNQLHVLRSGFRPGIRRRVVRAVQPKT